MGALFYLVCIGIGILLVILINLSNKPKCKHSWVLFQSRPILKEFKNRDVQIGFLKVYECEHCKKFLKEEVRVD